MKMTSEKFILTLDCDITKSKFNHECFPGNASKCFGQQYS